MSKSNQETEYRKLTREEVTSLAKRSAAGDVAARNELILSHVHLIEQHIGLFVGKGVDREDLYQEGCYGLIEAVDRYDYTKGVLLDTYASHWIRKRMSLALITQNMKNPITIPSDKLYYALRRYTRCRLELTEAYGFPPSTADIANALGITVEKAKSIEQLFFSFTPLDAERKTPGDKRPAFMPIQHCAPSAEEEAFNSVFRTELPLSTAHLTLRQREILSRRCGFTPSGEPETIEQVAANMHLARQTVTKDYTAALKTLRQALAEDSEQIYS